MNAVRSQKGPIRRRVTAGFIFKWRGQGDNPWHMDTTLWPTRLEAQQAAQRFRKRHTVKGNCPFRTLTVPLYKPESLH